MDLKKTTVRGLFNGNIQFSIPVYQRAYSWQKSNWEVFLEDLLQQVEKENEYSFGNILLETIKRDQHYEIIDGQQRLTTIVIFMRAIYNALREKNQESEHLEDILYFFKERGKIKLRPILNDTACFDSVIVDDKPYSVSSPSQECIISAKKFFIGELKRYDETYILKLLNLVLDSGINRIELEGKKEAALMFELQNNRGRDLTNMEKLKSFFMYQIYVNSSAIETEGNVEQISNFFKEIYKTIYDINQLDEDSILIYHCQAFLNKSYNYKSLEDIKKELKESNDRIQWIKEFCRNLSLTFSNIKKVQSNNCYYYKKLLSLSNDHIPAFIYPFIIKGYKFFGDETAKLDKLFHILEVLTFRYELISSRAEIDSRLSDILKNFDGNLETLKESIHKKLNDAWYWSDNRISQILNGWMYGNRTIHYLLWEYEQSIQSKGYSVGSLVIEKEQIEHISPQTEPDEAIAAGYEVNEDNLYSEEFKNKYLNCIGNLMLISGSHNASIGNKPFAEKLNSYQQNPLLKQQAEIVTFVKPPVLEWKTNNIVTRQEKIVGFAIKRWDFDSIK